MSFWGVVIRQGHPVTHAGKKCGKLRVSQATLGSGEETTTRSAVLCKVGDRKPVLICALLPEKSESVHLELELDEKYDIVFSVNGPRSVHLSGYYIRLPFPSLSDTESLGTNYMDDSDISTYGSRSQYGGSFINDNDEDDDDVKQVGESSNQRKKSRSLSEEEEFQLNDEIRKMLSDYEVKVKRKWTLPSGVIVQELSHGPTHAKIAMRGKNVKINYTGMLEETGQVFHTNATKPAFKFVLGENDFIDGMSAGIEGMRVGDKRSLTFPAPSLSGYGDPLDSLIVYEVELVDA